MEKRIGLLFALFLLLLAVAAMRALWLGTVRSGSLSERAVSQQIEDIEDPARRGTIYDRNGVELAVSEDSATVFAHPFLIDDPVKAAAQLAPLVGRTEDELLRKLSSKESFVYLRRKMDASLGEDIEKLEIEGIGMVTEPKRVYPQGFLASQVLGFVGTDNTGLSGLEYSQDDALAGEDGERRLVKDALGEPVSMIETKRSEPGEDLRLTLDSRIQERAEAVLSEVGETYTPQGATAVVMDPRSGELLALANWPQGGRQRPGRRAGVREAEPRRRGQLRAGLDIQGLHRGGRAVGRTGRAGHDARGVARDHGRGPHRGRGARGRRRDQDRLPDPEGVVQRGVGDDRPEAGRRALRQVGAEVRLRPGRPAWTFRASRPAS